MILELILTLGMQVPPTPVSQDRVPVTIALVDTLPTTSAGAKAVVLRRAAGSPRDVILIANPNATPAVLSAAITAYLINRPLFDTRGNKDQRVVVMTEDAPPFLKHEMAKFAVMIGRLRSQPIVQIIGIGAVQTTQVWLKPVQPQTKSPT